VLPERRNKTQQTILFQFPFYWTQGCILSTLLHVPNKATGLQQERPWYKACYPEFPSVCGCKKTDAQQLPLSSFGSHRALARLPRSGALEVDDVTATPRTWDEQTTIKRTHLPFIFQSFSSRYTLFSLQDFYNHFSPYIAHHI
jgi:hypothetical protein